MNSEYIDENVINVINNEYDYSNIIPTIEYIEYLAEYCDNALQYFLKLIEEDEIKNQQFKEDYKNYNYKKMLFDQEMNINIYQNNLNKITCKNIEMFKSAIKDGDLKNVNELNITLRLYFKRGIGRDLATHENELKIKFKPYEIKFIRKSNYNEMMINQMENNINEILNKFPKVNTIFCTKE